MHALIMFAFSISLFILTPYSYVFVRLSYLTITNQVSQVTSLYIFRQPEAHSIRPIDYTVRRTARVTKAESKRTHIVSQEKNRTLDVS